MTLIQLIPKGRKTEKLYQYKIIVLNVSEFYTHLKGYFIISNKKCPLEVEKMRRIPFNMTPEY